MGCTAARKAWQVLDNLERILALELFAAAQGIDFRRARLGAAARLGRGTRVAYELIRREVPFLEHDAVMYPYIEAVRRLIADRTLARAVAMAVAKE